MTEFILIIVCAVVIVELLRAIIDLLIAGFTLVWMIQDKKKN